MKNLLTLFTLVAATFFLVQADVAAQKFPALDKSPVDFAHYRVNNESVARAIYSRPQKNAREIFGTLVPYDKVWRTGANECTEVTFYKDVEFGGQEVKAGTYSLFTIPGEKNWTVILNNVSNQWGSYGYDAEQDVMRVEVPVQQTPDVVEAFSIIFSDENGASNMIMAWDRTMVAVPIMTK